MTTLIIRDSDGAATLWLHTETLGDFSMGVIKNDWMLQIVLETARNQKWAVVDERSES